jgi:rubrerythrin
MKNITKENLQAALSGESQAHVRYWNFAERARKDGMSNIARLFEAASASELIHATAHLRNLDGLKDTPANLEAAVGGENFEVAEMYPAYMAVADLQEEKGACRSFHNALEAEKVHAGLYRKALEAARAGKDIPETAYYVCPVCGYTMEGEPPDVCPVCGARHETFKRY